ncbi:MAG: hypothetical protein OXH96_04020 [Spirochaetaceae bacterium]|nr:hypothetical protein [Spirochaetaceae bacterium]
MTTPQRPPARRSRGSLARRRILAAGAIALTLLMVADDAFARRGGFSGGRSFSSRGFSSSGFSSRRSVSSWGSTRQRTGTTTRQSLSGTRGSTARANTRGVSQSSYQRARANGTTFQSRQQAEQAFVSRNASQYPSRYASQPTSRPAHIPQSTRVDGRNVNVTYNAGLGGYGYLHPGLGTWVLYSAMADAAMLSLLMSNNHYYYGPPPGAYVGGRSSGFWTGLMVIAIILAVFFVMRAGSRRY